jgi:hypothetical protein
MLTKVCIEIEVVDYEFYNSYIVSLNFKRGCIICGTNTTIVIKLILVREFFMEKLN